MKRGVSVGLDQGSNRWKIAAWGLFLLILGLYLLFSPARIDILDGQMRFEVSKNMLDFHGYLYGAIKHFHIRGVAESVFFERILHL